MSNNKPSHALDYLTLRKTLGLLGFFLPLILPLGLYLVSQFKEPGQAAFQPSISHYHLTYMRDVFVFILTSFGLFLITFGGDKGARDNVLSNIAGCCALLVAFFPTSAGDCDNWVCTLHFVSATAFFLILSYVSYFEFTKPNDRSTKENKEKRNKIYRISAIVMVSSIAILAIHMLIVEVSFFPYNITYIMETIALMAFGVSWWTKGRFLIGE